MIRDQLHFLTKKMASEKQSNGEEGKESKIGTVLADERDNFQVECLNESEIIIYRDNIL